MLTIKKYLLSGVLLIANIGAIAATDIFTAMDVDVPRVRVQAPAFSLDRLDGERAGLSDFAGKVVLLNFWATWCSPCRKEMPAMQRLWERYREQGFVILAVSADKGSRKQVKSFVEKHALSFPILLDPQGEVRKQYEVVGLPMSYLIGRDGRISGRILGVREWDGEKANGLVTELLSQDQ